MLQTTLTNLRTLSFACFIGAMLMVGVMTPTHQAAAQKVSIEQRTAMLEQIQQLLALISQLQAQLQAMQNSTDVKTTDAVTDELRSVELRQLTNQIEVGQTQEVFRITLPTAPYRDTFAYLNRAQIGVINESNNDKPWEVFESVSFKVNNFIRKTVDVSNRSAWRKTTWAGSEAYVLDLYDSADSGYGAIFRTTMTDVTLSIKTDRSADINSSQLWNWFIPENGIKVWTRSGGDESSGGFGVPLLVQPKGSKKMNDKDVTQKIIEIKNGTLPKETIPKKNNSLQNDIDDLLDQVSQGSNTPPGKNAFACDRYGSIKNGALACYGMWDYGESFGGDKNTCSATGCVITAPVCSSGKAVATAYYSNRTLEQQSNSALASIATNLRVTPAVVREEVAGLSEYKCTN